MITEAADRVDGVMLAVTSEDQSRLLDWLASGQSGAKAVLANDNAPAQVVLSGERSAITACAEFISHKNLGKCCFLAVSGPWHSPFMAEAAAHVDAWLRQIPMQPPRRPTLFGLTATRAETPENIRSMISGALAGPVRWAGCMVALRAMNPRGLLEVGPGRVLSGLARANGFGDTTRVFRVSDLRGVELAARTLFDHRAYGLPAAGRIAA